MKYLAKDNRGVALIITITVLGVVISIAVGIAALFSRELRISAFLDDSVAAIIAADSGIERALWEVRKNGANANASYGPVTLWPDGATYEVCPSGAGCRNNSPHRIISEGAFGDVKRSLEVEFD